MNYVDLVAAPFVLGLVLYILIRLIHYCVKTQGKIQKAEAALLKKRRQISGDIDASLRSSWESSRKSQEPVTVDPTYQTGSVLTPDAAKNGEQESPEREELRELGLSLVQPVEQKEEEVEMPVLGASAAHDSQKSINPTVKLILDLLPSDLRDDHDLGELIKWFSPVAQVFETRIQEVETRAENASKHAMNQVIAILLSEILMNSEDNIVNLTDVGKVVRDVLAKI